LCSEQHFGDFCESFSNKGFFDSLVSLLTANYTGWLVKKVKISKKSKRTPDELKDASKHLFWGMRYLSERLEFFLRFKDRRNAGELGGLLNSIHDAFLLHARKMIEFLYNSSDILYDDDLVAEDYFESPEIWRKLRPEQPEVLNRGRQNIGKLLAHLTYHVKNYPTGEVTWETSEIYMGIFFALQTFLDKVDRSLLDEQLDYLRLGNPEIVICYPLFPPAGKAYRIACTRDKASGIDINAEN
jgi:hypothetical protein